MKRYLGFFIAAALLPAQEPPAAPEIEPPARVARLATLDGTVSFEASGTSDWVAATLNRPLTTGDRLFIEKGARAELNIGSAAFRLGPGTGLNIDLLDDQNTRLILTEGTVIFRVKSLDENESVELDTPNGRVTARGAGLYRVDVAGPGKSLVSVAAGKATVNDQPVGSRQAVAIDGANGVVSSTALPIRDTFDQWSEARDRQADRSESAQYVAPGTIGSEDLDANGTWTEIPNYGRAWQPRAVAAGWAPYRFGHWVWVAPWGWTWVDDASWGFAPFHYGRWAYYGASWYWVPGPLRTRAVYAPALVSFNVGGAHFGIGIGVGSAPVSWVPLAPGEIWAPGFRATFGYWNRVNLSNTVIVNRTIIREHYGNTINRETIVYANRSAPGGMSTMSREAFTGAQPVHRSLVSPAPGREGVRGGESIPRAPSMPEPTRQSRLGAGSRSVSRPPEHIARRDVRPWHMERRR